MTDTRTAEQQAAGVPIRVCYWCHLWDPACPRNAVEIPMPHAGHSDGWTDEVCQLCHRAPRDTLAEKVAELEQENRRQEEEARRMEHQRWNAERCAWVKASPNDATAIRIRINRAKTARQTRTRHHAHTRDCRQPGVRESYARAHETLPPERSDAE